MNIEFLIEYAKNQIIQTDNLTPTFIAHTVRGERYIIPMLCTDEEKPKTLKTLKQFFALNEVVDYFFFMEVWSASHQKENEAHKAIKDRDDAKETLLVFHVSPNGNEAQSFLINRETAPVSFETMEADLKSARGTFLELLPSEDEKLTDLERSVVEGVIKKMGIKLEKIH